VKLLYETPDRTAVWGFFFVARKTQSASCGLVRLREQSSLLPAIDHSSDLGGFNYLQAMVVLL
ncbi:hypothetical protein, partial [Ectopseudomonas mendocina]|uniref:hypothetical protein n=1 Tax=Ectopseudomonas mendocina TaxID=300 RepID=UPI003F0A2E31